ncbi:hypothetical protein [Photorhabdus bodei]|uniref:hypothetical protein n=1 Tax=Photorhabdus bodei TaxID=2029681 RepID=UPI00138AF9C9|nr:hypothetical protein [Photorhabdus bodei]NDL10110.1 hypothetical protein [Photorhabdus bodei]
MKVTAFKRNAPRGCYFSRTRNQYLTAINQRVTACRHCGNGNRGIPPRNDALFRSFIPFSCR